MVRPKKHLGQHFLSDQNIAQKIAALPADTTDTVLEIGPGTGVLTRFLLPRYGKQLKLVEIDSESVEFLELHFPELQDQIIQADFLKLALDEVTDKNMTVVGNFPYNISSQIFFHILDYKDMVPEVVCMIQKEVAERIAAAHGSKTYGILSVLLQAWYDIQYCFTVNEQVFFPPPKVKSAVIRLKRNNTTELGCDAALFTQVVKQAFNQRRKTLRNALRSILPPDALTHEILSKRAEQLSVQDFVFLTNLVNGVGN